MKRPTQNQQPKHLNKKLSKNALASVSGGTDSYYTRLWGTWDGTRTGGGSVTRS